MLSVEDIRDVKFRRAKTLSAGYRAEDVDSFLDEVIATVDQLNKEKAALLQTIDRLTAGPGYNSDDQPEKRSSYYRELFNSL